MSGPVSFSPERPRHEWGETSTPFEGLGGEEGIRRLVDRFYDRIDRDAPTLRAMLPTDDSVSREKLFQYLTEWTGGPALYTPNRGHPMMRRRHLPFAIGPDEVAAWLGCFGGALDDSGVSGDLRSYLDARVGALAHHMQNRE